MFRNINFQLLGLQGSQSELIELALSFSFKSMDLNMPDFLKQAENYGLQHARRLIDSAQIPLACFRLPLQWGHWDEDERSYKEGVEQLPRIGEIARELGCTRCITAVQPASDERPFQENFEFHRKRLAEIAGVLSEYGVQVGLEFTGVPELREGRAFQFINSFNGMNELAKMSGADNVGVVVDLWQIHIAGGSLDEVKDLSPDRVLAVYLSDLPVDADLESIRETARLLPMETGVIDAVAALRMLAEMGYEGPVTPRAPRRKLPGRSRDDKVRHTSERLNKIWIEAGLGPQPEPEAEPQTKSEAEPEAAVEENAAAASTEG